MPGEADHDRPRPGAVPIRASDAERDHVIDALRDAAAEGRLTFEELADRIDAAGRAVTRDDLGALIADLPPTGGHGAAGLPSAVAPADGPGTAVRAPENRRSVFGDVRQAGAWRVPYVSRWSTVFGDIDIDLREAVVSHGRIEIDAQTVFGDVTLLVPEGVVVDVRSRTGFGVVRQEAGESGPPGAPVVVLTGGSWFGDVRVRAKRLRERLADVLRGRLGP
ncbi:DUF1707 domain-containing protein [Patulibacter sp.]|uniref:DUF1707 SHOCT-like domain-containing protein n=1 Tax=Patulibacter sp. TaxID=1912859 RepID=UPI00271EF802|nr:DUF1707 domain-containing protein [Patulibacter sp.]MDO9409581.1 DUF1707 domain-containing protein [Patulibacter sp.]